MLMRIFFFILGRVKLGDCLTHSPKNIYVHKFLYKYSHRMSPTFPHSHSKVSMFFERETTATPTSKSGESGVAYLSISITFTLSLFARFSFHTYTVLVKRWKYRRKYFLFLENIKKRVNGFLSIPHLMQRYRDCTI